MIEHIPSTLLHPSPLKIHILPNPILNRFIILNLQKLFLNCMNIIKAKCFIQKLKCLVEILD